jgi:hypothetical protein
LNQKFSNKFWNKKTTCGVIFSDFQHPKSLAELSKPKKKAVWECSQLPNQKWQPYLTWVNFENFNFETRKNIKLVYKCVSYPFVNVLREWLMFMMLFFRKVKRLMHRRGSRFWTVEVDIFPNMQISYDSCTWDQRTCINSFKMEKLSCQINRNGKLSPFLNFCSKN